MEMGERGSWLNHLRIHPEGFAQWEMVIRGKGSTEEVSGKGLSVLKRNARGMSSGTIRESLS